MGIVEKLFKRAEGYLLANNKGKEALTFQFLLTHEEKERIFSSIMKKVREDKEYKQNYRR